MPNNYEDPFFPNGEDNNEQKNNQNSVNDFEEKPQDKNDSEKSYGFLDNNAKPAEDSQNSAPYYIIPTERKKNKNGLKLGMILLIMIPILVITNVLTSLYVFNNVWQDAKTAYTAEINELIAKDTYLPDDATLIARSVSKECIGGVLELTSSYSGGSAAGTGFIISSDGYVLTNAHVVTYEKTVYVGRLPTKTTAAVDSVKAQFYNDDNVYEMSVVAYSEDLDIAVLKFVKAPSSLKVLELEDSSLLSFGDPAVAIGNAQGYGIAVTEGVISAPIQYFNLGSSSLTAAIQHSAAINPGNSGGPLLNAYGKVVGINTFKLASSNTEISVDGMGFAIPTAVVKDYVNGLNLSDLKITFAKSGLSVTG